MSNKKRILIWSDYVGANTGFGKNARNLLEALHKTGKYELCNYACGMGWDNDDFQRWPWLTKGTLPVVQGEMDNFLNQFPPHEREHRARWVSYGNFNIDKIIKEFKPDFLLGINDPWGFDVTGRDWWDKFPCALHITVDSLPLLGQAQDLAKKCERYFVWSEFAEKAHHEAGQKHVKTLHGALKTNNFKPLTDSEKKQLRFINNIPEDAFIIGFVFRNQLRKSVIELLQGYKMFKAKNPHIKNPRLLLHTHFGEGWDIPRHLKEFNIDPNEVYCTYICHQCAEYEIKPFTSMLVDCNRCGIKGTQPNQQYPQGLGQVTANTQYGVNEEQLNEVYNCMDVYCHPFTSGGMEIPIFEAKLAGLVTCVTNYSCGEDSNAPEAASMPLDWVEYREFGTAFIKARTMPTSIEKQLTKVAAMDPRKRKEMGLKARDWTIKNYDSAVVAQQISDIVDILPETTFDFEFKKELKDPTAIIQPMASDADWLKQLYKEILKMSVEDNDSGLLYWIRELKEGKISKGNVEAFFRQEARKENSKNEVVDFEKILDTTGKKRVIAIMPQSMGDIIMFTSLFKSLRELYPADEWMLYISTEKQYAELVEGNEYIDRWIEYRSQFDNSSWLQGMGPHKGYFEVSLHPYWGTQRLNHYTQNGHSKIAFKLNSSDVELADDEQIIELSQEEAKNIVAAFERENKPLIYVPN